MNLFIALLNGTPEEWAADIARLIAGALVSGLWKGILLSVAAGLLLRMTPKSTAAVRFWVWAAVFCVSVAMPFVDLPHAAFASRMGAIAGPHVVIDLRWSYLLSGLWVAASLYRMGELLLQAAGLRTLWKSAVPVAGKRLAEVEAPLFVGRRRVELCISNKVDRPSVIGFFAPRILIPAWLFEVLSAVELNHIVLHEMEHLRRRDDWVNLLQKIGLMLLPLNPALFWIDRRLATERELACDDGVLERTKTPRAYAASLASVAERRLEARSGVRLGMLALAATGLRRRSELGRRIEGILGLRAPVNRTFAGIVAAVMVAGVVGGSVELARVPQLVSFAPAGGGRHVADSSPALDRVVPSDREGAALVGARARDVRFRVPESATAGASMAGERRAVSTTRSRGVPQRLKPQVPCCSLGTSKLVPLSKTGFSTNADGSAREGRTPGAKAHIETIDFIARAEALAYPEADAKPVKSESKLAMKSVAKSEAKPVVTQQWMVLTSFHEGADDEDPPARVVVRLEDGRLYVIPYAAVPVRDGWLIVQL